MSLPVALDFAGYRHAQTTLGLVRCVAEHVSRAGEGRGLSRIYHRDLLVLSFCFCCRFRENGREWNVKQKCGVCSLRDTNCFLFEKLLPRLKYSTSSLNVMLRKFQRILDDLGISSENVAMLAFWFTKVFETFTIKYFFYVLWSFSL